MGARPSPQKAGEHPNDDVERTRAGVDRHGLGAPPQPQRRKETGNPEHVVEMAVGQQDPIKPSEAGAAPKQLALRALPTIHQYAMAADLHQKTRMVAVRGRDARRSSKKRQIEHDRGDALVTAS